MTRTAKAHSDVAASSPQVVRRGRKKKAISDQETTNMRGVERRGRDFIPVPDSSAVNRANEVTEWRTSAGTKATYKSHLKQLMAFVSTNHPTCIDANGNLKLPVPTDVIMAFCGEQAQPATERRQYKRAADIPNSIAQRTAAVI